MSSGSRFQHSRTEGGAARRSRRRAAPVAPVAPTTAVVAPAAAQAEEAVPDGCILHEATVGRPTRLSTKDVASYSVGDSGSLQVVVDPKGQFFVVTPRRKGSTTLLVLESDGGEACHTFRAKALPPT